MLNYWKYNISYITYTQKNVFFDIKLYNDFIYPCSAIKRYSTNLSIP